MRCLQLETKGWFIFVKIARLETKADIVVYEDLIFLHVNKCYQVIMIIINGLQGHNITHRLSHFRLLRPIAKNFMKRKNHIP